MKLIVLLFPKQVEVIVNGVPSKCKEGVDCSFEYKDEATPEITSLSPLSGNYEPCSGREGFNESSCY